MSPGGEPFEDFKRVTSGIARGDEACFERMYRRFFDRLYRRTLAMTRGDEIAAGELTQTTMIRAAQAMPVMGEERQVWGWLVAVARNAAIDQARRNQRGPDFVPLIREGAEADPRSEAEDDLLSILDDGVRRLAKEDRDLLEEFYMEGRSSRDCAKRASVSPKAIESRLARARAKLKRFMLQALQGLKGKDSDEREETVVERGS